MLDTFTPSQLKFVTTPELRKGNKVLYYGAIYEILEDAVLQEDGSHGCSAKFIKHSEEPYFNDGTLESIGSFKGNSNAKQTLIIE